LAKWKIFGKSKPKKEDKSECEEIVHPEPKEILEPEEEIIIETKQDTEEPTVIEYRKTLYSEGYAPKKDKISSKTNEEPWKRRSWENMSTIEKNVDGISKKKMETKTSIQTKSSDTDKKVDKLLSKKKI